MTQSCKVFARTLNTGLINVIKHLDDPTIDSPLVLCMQITGDKNAGRMLHRLIYWLPRAKKFGDWVYKSAKHWLAELGLTENQTKRVHSKNFLENIGVERELMKANGAPTNHYRLNVQAFLQTLADFCNLTVQQVKRLLEGKPLNPPSPPKPSVPQHPNHSAQTTESITSPTKQSPTTEDISDNPAYQKALQQEKQRQQKQAFIQYCETIGIKRAFINKYLVGIELSTLESALEGHKDLPIHQQTREIMNAIMKAPKQQPKRRFI